LFLKTDGAGNLSFSSDLPTTSFTGATVETSIAGGDLVLVYDDSATAVRKMTRTNFVAGIGGNMKPAFFAFKNANQSIANDTDTLVSFQTEVLDTDSCFDNSSTYRFTPTVAGKYFIFATLEFNGSGANDVRDVALRFNRNGTYLNYNGGWDNYSSSSARVITVTHTTVVDMNGSSDYIAVYGRMVAGTRNISGGYPDANARNVVFGGYRIIE
jgi:hypothetical protein